MCLNSRTLHTHHTFLSSNKQHRRLETGNKHAKRKKRQNSNNIRNVYNNNIVTNLSDYKLSTPELLVLNKGLTFVPNTQIINYKQINIDITRFERQLQLQYFFQENKTDNTNKIIKPFEDNPSFWPHKLNPHITQYCNKLRDLIIHCLTKHKSNSNLTTRERTAITKLKHNQDIIIKKADKSAGIVILNKQDYEDKIYSMLNDINVYTRTNINDTTDVKNISDSIAKQLYDAQYINSKQFRNFTNFIPKCPIFYGSLKYIN